MVHAGHSLLLVHWKDRISGKMENSYHCLRKILWIAQRLKVSFLRHLNTLLKYITLYFIETHLNTFANRSDQDQAVISAWSESTFFA